MTRWKFAAAVLALGNVGYFLWARGPGGAPSPSADPSPAATLTLASEAPAATSTPGPDTAAAGSPGGGGAPAESAASTAAPASGTATAPTEEARRCVSVGPFRDVAEAAHAASTLRAGGYDPRQRVAEGEVWAGLWVYVPVPANRAAGEPLLARLKAAGIDDALQMPGPNDVPVYSLGLFSEPKRAQARVTQAQALGMNPIVADRKRTGNVYWIDIDLKPTDGPVDASELRGESGRILRLEVKACPPAGAAP